MLRRFNVTEINYGTVEIDIPPDIVSKEDIEDCVMDAINKGDVYWYANEVTDITETN